MANHQAEMARGYCLHPQASETTCSTKIIRAHTVQRKGGLAAVAENGHVISLKSGFRNIVKNEGNIVPALTGVGDASTFMGFCGWHDEQLFAPIEKSSIDLREQAAFLLSFRAVCYEKFQKDAAYRSIEIQREGDKGDPFEVQIAKQNYLHYMREGIKRGMRDLERWKKRYDEAFISGNYNLFSYYGVRFSSDLPLVACGALHPDFDINGNRLQIITRGESEFDHLCLNLTVVNGKSVAVFGWTGEHGGAAETFVRSFRALPKSEMANVAFHIASEYFENTYFRPSWWDAQTDSAREHLIRRFRTGLGWGHPERTPDSLSRLEYSFSTASVELESSS